jgi:hypothetical protein
MGVTYIGSIVTLIWIGEFTELSAALCFVAAALLAAISAFFIQLLDRPIKEFSKLFLFQLFAFTFFAYSLFLLIALLER